MKKTAILILCAAVFMTADAFGATMSEIMPMVKKAKTKMSAALDAIDKDVSAAAKKLTAIDRNSVEARKILSSLCEGRPYAYACSIVDTTGKLSVVEPEKFRNYEGADISAEPQVKELFRTKTPVVSPVFAALDGTKKIDFEYPIITQKGEFIGAVSLLIDHQAFFKEVLAPLVDGQPLKIWAIQTDGLVLYDDDPDQINKNVFRDPMFTGFVDLRSFCRTVADFPNGGGSYTFYKKGLEDQTVVKKYAVWDTASLHGTKWRIVVMEIEPPEAVRSEGKTEKVP